MVFYSHSFPQLPEECSHCGEHDVTCWENCLFETGADTNYYDEFSNYEFEVLIDEPALASGMSCGLIRTCLKTKFGNKPHCKNAPKKLPARCGPVVTGVNPVVTGVNPDPNCKCCNRELDGPGGLPIGHCLTKDPTNNEFYCYVDANTCLDSKPSKRFHNLHYSYQACWNQRADGFAAPECNCQEWDYQCQSECNAHEETVATGCYCQDDDDQCFADCLSDEVPW